MTISAFTLLLLVSELSQCDSTCTCPSSHPACESDGHCWMRSSGHWSYKGLSCGSCKSSYSSSSHVLKNSDKGSIGRCYSYYGSSSEWCYTQTSDGYFASSGCSSYDGYGTEWCCPDKYRCRESSPAPAPPATSADKLSKSALGSIGRCFSYFGEKGKEWCYTRKKDGSFASSNCESYDGYKTDWCCPEKYKCQASGGSSGGCHASGLGKYIADFAKGKNGKKVYSEKQGTASCWDLAWGAMEQAAKHGYNPVFYQKESNWADSYVWSSEVVPVEEAKPGDIAQFKGWQEPYLYAWNPHTAVVTDCFKDGVLTTYQQNPDPVAEGKYHPHQKTSGSVTIYRLKSGSRLRLYSQMPQFEVIGLHSGQLSMLAGVCAIAGLIATASFIVKRQRSAAWSAPPTIEEEAMLCPDTLNPESVEVPIA